MANDLEAGSGTLELASDLRKLVSDTAVEPVTSSVVKGDPRGLRARDTDGHIPAGLFRESVRSPANQSAQVSLVSGDATAHEDSLLSVDVDAAYARAEATGLLPD